MPNVSHHTIVGNTVHNVLANVSTGTADVTIQESVARDYGIIEVTTGHATYAVILPTTVGTKGRVYTIVNKSAAAALVKRAGQTTPVTVATLKSAMIYFNGTDYVRLTPDA